MNDRLISKDTEQKVWWWMSMLRTFCAARPTAREWKNANKLFEHPKGCRCSTCDLAAGLAACIRWRGDYRGINAGLLT